MSPTPLLDNFIIQRCFCVFTISCKSVFVGPFLFVDEAEADAEEAVVASLAIFAHPVQHNHGVIGHWTVNAVEVLEGV